MVLQKHFYRLSVTALSVTAISMIPQHKIQYMFNDLAPACQGTTGRFAKAEILIAH